MPEEPEPLYLPESGHDIGGWTLVDESVETLFQLPTVRIRGRLCRYDDEQTRTALETATGIDHPVRFVATTRLGFRPSLPPGTGPGMILPTLLPEARRSFADQLADRGLTGIERASTERIRAGDQTVSLTRYRATDPLKESPDSELPLECWLGVWADETVNIFTTGYPTSSLVSVLGLESGDSLLETTGQEYREAFRSLLSASCEQT